MPYHRACALFRFLGLPGSMVAGTRTMPKVINGKRVTAAEHAQWKAVFEKTGSGGKATNAVKRTRRAKQRRLG